MHNKVMVKMHKLYLYSLVLLRDLEIILPEVSQSYSGQPSQIVEKILRDETYLKSKKTFYFEPTANNVKIVFPNVRPFKCIKHLSNISNSQLK